MTWMRGAWSEQLFESRLNTCNIELYWQDKCEQIFVWWTLKAGCMGGRKIWIRTRKGVMCEDLKG